VEGILIPISFFAMIAAIVVLPKYFRARSKDRLMETLQTAYEKGQPVPPELIETLTADPVSLPRSPRQRAETDLRSGIIWLAVALGLVAMGWAISYEEDEALYIFAGIAAIPGFIGLALIALGLSGRGRSAV
jgi:hypothetical protein